MNNPLKKKKYMHVCLKMILPINFFFQTTHKCEGIIGQMTWSANQQVSKTGVTS